MVFILQSYISDTIPISQELESEPRKLRSRFAECSVSCLAVEVEYRNTDWRRSGEVGQVGGSGLGHCRHCRHCRH